MFPASEDSLQQSEIVGVKWTTYKIRSDLYRHNIKVSHDYNLTSPSCLRRILPAIQLYLRVVQSTLAHRNSDLALRRVQTRSKSKHCAKSSYLPSMATLRQVSSVFSKAHFFEGSQLAHAHDSHYAICHALSEQATQKVVTFLLGGLLEAVKKLQLSLLSEVSNYRCFQNDSSLNILPHQLFSWVATFSLELFLLPLSQSSSFVSFSFRQTLPPPMLLQLKLCSSWLQQFASANLNL